VLSSLHAVAMIVTPLVMTSLLSLFSRPSMPVYFPGAPFLLAAMMVVACLIIFMRLRNLLENPTSSTPQ
jgi:DHA1 family tetracycline resistance protein-like MFS transporter